MMEVSPPIGGNPWLRDVAVQVDLFSGDPGLVYLWLSKSALTPSCGPLHPAAPPGDLLRHPRDELPPLLQTLNSR